MQTYEILVKNRSVVANSNDMTLVRTSVGIDQLHVLFDNDEWLDFPITVTFASENDIVSQQLIVTRVTDSDEWVAEATATIPWEVIDETGSIRLTFQGTDSNGRHIITAKGSPLSVEEAGDIVIGTEPDGSPTVSEWEQAYADAMAAVNQAASLVSNLQNQLDTMLANAAETVAQLVDIDIPLASRTTAGLVKVGSGVNIASDGTISVAQSSNEGGMTTAQLSTLVNLSRLAYYGFDSSFGDDGELIGEELRVKRDILPLAGISVVGAVKVDDETIMVSTDGTIRADHPIATVADIGMVKPDGATVNISPEGVISIPTGAANSLGLLKPDGVTITATDGVLTATGSDGTGFILPTASTSTLGGVKVDGTTIVIDENGVISLNTADDEEF